MEYFICITSSIMNKMGFTPIVLIGLLITSLSFIINLKSNNIYISKFKQSSNIDRFLNLIFRTSGVLLSMLIIFIFNYYITNFYVKFIISILYLLGIIFIFRALFIMVFILKEIVRISLKEE